jgi:hypothetical protein
MDYAKKWRSGEMKLQTKTGLNSRKKQNVLIKYFDNSWKSFNELLDTPKAKDSNLNIKDLIRRYNSKKSKTLEHFLRPKRNYKTDRMSNTEMFQGCPDRLIKILESGNNKDLLEYDGGRILKVRGEFRIPGISKKSLITREIEVDENRLKKVDNQDLFMKMLFIHHISEELDVKCKMVV